MAALLAALLLAAAPDGHGRLVVSAAAGGGWATDPYLGAGSGAGPMAELVPGARLDLALSPRVKLAAGADASWMRFRAGDFEARALAAGAEARFVRRSAEAALGLGGEVARYPTGAPAGEGAEGPTVSRTAKVSATPAVRARWGAALAWLSATGHLARSRTVEGDVDESGLSGAGGGSWAVGARLTLLASAHADRVFSADDAFAYRAAGCEVGAVTRPAGALDVTAHAGYDHTRFETGVVEDLLRGDVELSHPVGPVTALVAWSVAWSDAGARGTHARQLVFAGVRGQLGVASW